MRKLQIFLYLLLFSLATNSQIKISVYKSYADKAIENYFDESNNLKIKCTDIALYGLDSSLIFIGDFDYAKNRKEKISTVTFFYSLYSKKLNYLFDFEITIGRNKKVLDDTTIFINIPNCVAKNIDCNFITKDSAINIAIKDSISYPYNVKADLYKHYKNYNYYWFVRSSPITKKTRKRRATKRSSEMQERIVNATTGEIISRKNYYER